MLESRARLPSGDLICGYHVRTDLTGTGVTGGVRAAGVSAIGGLLRQWELDQGQIDHAVALALPDTAQAGGPIWPATAQDSDAAVAYRGHVPLGTLLAIPSSVDVTTLGLTPGGLVLADACSRTSAPTTSTRRARGCRARCTPIRAPTRTRSSSRCATTPATLVRHLRAVTNNSLVAVGGAPAAPWPVLAASRANGRRRVHPGAADHGGAHHDHDDEPAGRARSPHPVASTTVSPPGEPRSSGRRRRARAPRPGADALPCRAAARPGRARWCRCSAPGGPPRRSPARPPGAPVGIRRPDDVRACNVRVTVHVDVRAARHRRSRRHRTAAGRPAWRGRRQVRS